MIKLIVALGPNNLIGQGTRLPWHLPEELKFFQATTMGQWLLMGRKTFEGLPQKLHNRKICVLSSHQVKAADHCVHSQAEAAVFLAQFKVSEKDIFIAGGKKVYETFYHLADELIVSYIFDQNYIGDVYLNWDLTAYTQTLIKQTPDFKTYAYRKKEK